MKNYLFARICRVIGRFLLTLGTVFFIGSLAILFIPKPSQNPSTEGTSLSHQTIHSIINNNDTIAFADTPANNVALTALGIVLAISIIIIFVLVMRHYNDDIRKIIGKISKLTKLSIHQVELLATTLVWFLCPALRHSSNYRTHPQRIILHLCSPRLRLQRLRPLITLSKTSRLC